MTRETFEGSYVPRLIGKALLIMSCSTTAVTAATWDPAGGDYAGRKGVSLYVSRLGDNSDGSSWAKAFHTIQAALQAVPDEKGGHRVIVRPDVYIEANLYPSHKGAEGAYNLFVGDFDGKLGSGATGWVVIDSGDPAKGFKSYDWWSTIRATSKGWSPQHTEETFSAIIWDRWICRRLYSTGADAGLFWDCTNQVKPFTVVVEDCVGIGRAFGGGVGNCLSRTDEPISFRRCHLYALDWWGDTAAAYIRVENTSMPDRPDAVLEDCTMVSPQCALKTSNFGFKSYTRVGLKDCRLIVLNFSQPPGTPTDGIVQCVEHGKYQHVDFEDCTLMGYKVFGVRVNKKTVDQIQYTTKGSVQAYVQFQQDVPKGFERLTTWPVDVFKAISPPGTSATPATPDKSVPSARAETDEARTRRAEWFNEAKFGMFVHWGLYAVPARNNKGAYVSWMMNNEGIPVAEYEKYADHFKPTKFDAKQWMEILKSAGMRYMILTSKHHEGFCMFDSKLTDYDAMDRAAKRDFVRELIAAARGAGVKIGFYYSTLDWHQPDYKADLAKYVRGYMIPQVRELCANYGPIDCVWFDGEWDHPASTWRAEELVRMIRELQPDAVINDRLGKGERGVNPLCDFYTREQPVEIRKATDFEKKRSHPWEACLTIGTSWGYKKGDAPLKSGQELIRTLVDVASRGGNVLLNVGPTADGEIPAPLVSRLREIGVWMAKNGESIYGTYGSPFASLPAGKCTTKGNRLYIHLESRPGDRLGLPGLRNEIKRAWLLATGASLAFDNGSKTITLPAALPDETVATIAAELDGEPVVK
ncbi:MAG: alpha-L-fucosidase [Phycisphaerae bacterium]|nr:alpha-L-fucosidase [Phycisphaerae bacterium]